MASDIQQGIIGDCSFLSALTNYVQTAKPADVQSRIKGNPSAKRQRPAAVSEVQMYDKNGKAVWIKVMEPTTSQRLLYAHAVSGSLWVSLFEEAYLQLRIQEGYDPVKGAQLVNGSYFEQAAGGESMATAIRRLTGSIGTTIQAISSFATDADLIQQLPVAGKSHAVVSVSTLPTLPKEALAKPLVPQHAYAVSSYEPSTGMVTLLNPWNNPNIPGGVSVQVNIAQLRLWFNNLATQNLVIASSP